MLLSSLFCNQFAYIKVLVPGVTYLTHGYGVVTGVVCEKKPMV